MNAIKVYEALPDTVPASLHAAGQPRFDAGPGFGLPPQEHMAPSQRFVLPRLGMRPLRFSGVALGRESSRGSAAPAYALALYRMDDGRHVAQIEVQEDGAETRALVQVAGSLDAAMTVFEEHDPHGDVAADFALDEAGVAPAEIMVRAAALRYRMADAASRYRALLGRFLAAVDAG
jgi:hypothetical protein